MTCYLRNQTVSGAYAVFVQICFAPPQVSDRGGGVPLRKIDRLFTYTYSTAPRPSMEASRAAPLVSPPRLQKCRQSFSVSTAFCVTAIKQDRNTD